MILLGVIKTGTVPLGDSSKSFSGLFLRSTSINWYFVSVMAKASLALMA